MFKKNKINFILGIIVGIIISGSIVYAINVSSSSVSYTKSGSSVTNVSDALDELYNAANSTSFFVKKGIEVSNLPTHYNYSTGIDSSAPTTYTTLGKSVFLALWIDGQKGVCIIKDSKLSCFRSNNWVFEKEHILEVFNRDSCIVNEIEDVGASVICDENGFYCDVNSGGQIHCITNGTTEDCYVRGDGTNNCLHV